MSSVFEITSNKKKGNRTGKDLREFSPLLHVIKQHYIIVRAGDQER